MSLNYGTSPQEKWNDNWVRAYFSPGGSGNFDIVGLVGFDLSKIPDSAIIKEIGLDLHYKLNTTIQGTPITVIQYSTANNWTRSSSSVETIPLTQIVSSTTSRFPKNEVSTFQIDVGARDWSTDLADDWITLGIDNIVEEYTYVYFEGVGNFETNPRLEIIADICR